MALRARVEGHFLFAEVDYSADVTLRDTGAEGYGVTKCTKRTAEANAQSIFV